MSFKTILVHCDAGEATKSRLALACDLARQDDAHLICLHVRAPFEPPLGVDRKFDVAAYQLQLRQAKADLEKSNASYLKAVGHQDLVSEWHVVDLGEDVIEHARCADLVVVGQTSPYVPLPGVPTDLAEAVALRSGRPVLVVPLVGRFAVPLEVVMLCWNGSREAVRAAAEALPILQRARKVIVLTIDSAATHRDAAASAGKVVAWLHRHGVEATTQCKTDVDVDIGNLILASAAELDADLIVMGAYGHSRLRELVLGGASRAVLTGASIPLLLAH